MWGPPPGGWTPQSSAPAPYAKKQSIVDRVLGRLFPTAQYSGLLDPSQQGDLQHQGLLQVGLNLLQSGGRSPHQAGTLANIGSAIQSVNFPEMAQHAVQLRAYQQQQAVQQRVGEVAAQTKSIADPYQRVAAMVSELAGVPGTEDLVGKLSNVLAQLKPERRERPRYVFKGLQENGHEVIYRVNEDDPTDRIRIGLAPPQAGMLNPTEGERRAGALFTVGEDAYNQLKNAAAPSITDVLANKVPGGFGQGAVSRRQQLQNQAGAQLYRSYLYIVSGATVNPNEAEETAKTFIPQLGDDPATIAQKARARDTMVQAMRQAMGRASGGAVPGAEPSAGGGNFDDFLTKP